MDTQVGMLVLVGGEQKNPLSEAKWPPWAAQSSVLVVLERGSGLVPDEGTYVFSGLQVNDGQLPSLALCDEGQVSAGFDLHGCAERQCQVCPSGGKSEKQRVKNPDISTLKVASCGEFTAGPAVQLRLWCPLRAMDGWTN